MLIKINVEGGTEYQFVRKIIRPHLNKFGYNVVPFINETSPEHHGGITRYEKFRENMLMLKPRKEPCVISTMIDFYQLPKDFPGMSSLSSVTADEDKVLFLEKSLKEDLSDLEPYFIPYIQLHEFEALLFSDIHEVDRKLKVNRGSRVIELRTLLERYGEPENINTVCAPSIHLKNLYPVYRKVAEGIPIAERIGLDVMREKCHHFDYWMKELEEFGFAKNQPEIK
ncbi:MAG: DUF4276 family protein [Methanocorpusculum sp.]|nr:DUF4276 family protein [Methanocorpusculum sp.]